MKFVIATILTFTLWGDCYSLFEKRRYSGVILSPDEDKIYTDTKPIPTRTKFRSSSLRSSGILESFLKDVFDALVNLRDKKMKPYCNTVSKSVKQNYGDVDKVNKFFNEFCKHSEEIKDNLVQYRKDLDVDLPARNDFFEAINQAFWSSDAGRFSDYVADIKDYNKGSLPDVMFFKKTKNIIAKTIVKNIKKLTPYYQKDLKKKFDNAIKEYKKYDTSMNKITLSNGTVIEFPNVSSESDTSFSL